MAFGQTADRLNVACNPAPLATTRCWCQAAPWTRNRRGEQGGEDKDRHHGQAKDRNATCAGGTSSDDDQAEEGDLQRDQQDGRPGD